MDSSYAIDAALAYLNHDMLHFHRIYIKAVYRFSKHLSCIYQDRYSDRQIDINTIKNLKMKIIKNNACI